MRIAIVTEEFGWPAAVAGFLGVHGADVLRGTASEVDSRTA
ncbi:hypothetical protein AB0C15_15145 [Micromonospora sp. NPDC048835]